MNLLRSSSWVSLVEPLVDVGGVDLDPAAVHLGGLETQLLQQPLHDRVEPAGADVLRPLVHLKGVLGQRRDRVVA